MEPSSDIAAACPQLTVYSYVIQLCVVKSPIYRQSVIKITFLDDPPSKETHSKLVAVSGGEICWFRNQFTMGRRYIGDTRCTVRFL
jgi:hypothetical protein